MHRAPVDRRHFRYLALHFPIASTWVSPPEGITIELAPSLTSSAASDEITLLAPSSELLHLQQTHAGGRRDRGGGGWK
jgi:hypothetical protein